MTDRRSRLSLSAGVIVYWAVLVTALWLLTGDTSFWYVTFPGACVFSMFLVLVASRQHRP